MIALGAAVVGAISQSIATAVQVKQSKKAAKRNREFQERMRATQMQARVEDLRLAGLNPILAAGGPGAASPAGNLEQVPDIGGHAAKSTANILAAIRQKSELKTMTSQRQSMKVDRREAMSRILLNEQLTHKAHSAKQLQDAQWGIVNASQAEATAAESVFKTVPQAKWLSIMRKIIK